MTEDRRVPRAKAISHQRIGLHRGRPRIWIEGRKLERGGIGPGDRFRIEWDRAARRVVMSFDEDGDRRVSKRSRNGRDVPIVDVNAGDIEEALGHGIGRAKVSVFSRRIVVDVHPDDRDAMERMDRLMGKVRRGEPLQTGSLAHGGGVLDHALHEGLGDVGIRARLAFAVEMDPATLDVAATNNPIWDGDTVQVEASMDEVDFEDLPPVDVLVAGLPCVGASRAGKAKNGNELAEDHVTAGHLFVTFLALVKQKNPAIVLLENVPDFAGTVSATVVRKTLAVRGYELHEAILDGNELGALEMRRRWCLLATSAGLDMTLRDLAPIRRKEATLGEILEDCDVDSESWRDVVHMFEKAERDRAKGSNFTPNFVDGNAPSVRTMGASYWKWRPTEPKVAHPSDPRKARILTVVEHARAKTVPPGLVANVSGTLAHRILGNGVIHTAFQAVGRMLGERMLALANEDDGASFTDLDLPPTFELEDPEFGTVPSP